MAYNIDLEVAGKYIKLPACRRVVVSCNEDYHLRFSFSSEWSDYTEKTVLLSDGRKLYSVKLTGGATECDLPRVREPHMYELGVIAGTGPALATVGLPILVMPSISSHASGTAAEAGAQDMITKLEGALSSAADQLEGMETATAAANSAAALAGDAADAAASARQSATYAATQATSAASAANTAATAANSAAAAATDAAEAANDAADAAEAAAARQKLTFSGAVSAEYDGTAAVSVSIPAQPTALPSPAALTITVGQDTVSYDGSAAKTVTIAGGSSAAPTASAGLETILTHTTTAAATSFSATLGNNGAAFSLRHWILELLLPYSSSGTGTWDSLSLYAPGSSGYDGAFEQDMENEFFIDHPGSGAAAIRFEGDSDMGFGRIDYIRRELNLDEPDIDTDLILSTHPAATTVPLTKVEIGQINSYRFDEYGPSSIPAGTKIRLLGIRS